MKNFKFLSTTYYTKIMFILKIIHNNHEVTQMDIAKSIGTGDAIVNRYIKDLCANKYLEKKGKNNRNIKYILTRKGDKYLEELYLTYLFELILMYKQAKEPLVDFVKNIWNENIKTVLLYGAGEVVNVAIEIIKSNGLKIAGIVDDSIIKQGKSIENYLVISSKEISKRNYDAIIITSFSYRKEILQNIKDLDINKPVMMFGTTDFKISNFLRYQ